MDAISSVDYIPPAPRSRRRAHSSLVFLPHALSQLPYLISAILLMILAGSALLLFWMGTPASIARAATGCPTSGLPPTPTSGSPLDPASIKLNEILTNPKKDWNCDGKADGSDRWIELINTSGSDESLFGLQLASQGQTLLLNSSDRIGAHSYLVIFSIQIPTIPLSSSFGQLELLDSSGSAIDTVNYPALGADQSYARTSGGQWQTTSTPTPGAANKFTSGSNPTPKPTPTKRSGGGGGGSTAIPTPVSSVFIPTNTPSSEIALQNPGNNAADSSGGTNSLAVPSWLKIALLALIGVILLGVVIWYLRTWNQEPEGDG
jgi:hypothetical protein